MCSVVGAEGIRNIYLGQQAHASRYQTQQLTAGQLHKLPPQEVITVWAMPHCPQDTQLGPTEIIFIQCTGAAGRETANCRILFSPLSVFSQ